MILQYMITLVCLLLCDIVWLTTMMDRLYKKTIGHIFAPSPCYPAAIIFYLLYATGVFFLVVRPAGNSWRYAAVYGALLGLVAYGTYDLTNHATVRDWPLQVTVIDMAWGAAMTSFISVIAVACKRFV